MSRPTVLIIEDDKDNWNIYSAKLEHDGYQVLRARDGAEGIELAEERIPDLILMDLSVPIINGWDATEILKKRTETGGIPIVAVTAHAMPGDREKALQIGCDGYLAKPVTPQRVAEVVKQHVGPASGT